MSLEGLGLAAKRGFLHFSDVKGVRCWIVGERSGRIATARRLDGEPFRRSDGSCYKSHALTGKAWPAGIAGLPGTPDAGGAILLCEGEGDFLAAFHFMAEWGEPHLYPVAMLGRTQELRPEVASRLAGWRIRCFPHADPDGGGIGAMERWARSIPSANADGFHFQLDELPTFETADGALVKDLNDAARRSMPPAIADDPMTFANPLPHRHPCDDSERVNFDHQNAFRIQYWGRIGRLNGDQLPVVDGAPCPF